MFEPDALFDRMADVKLDSENERHSMANLRDIRQHNIVDHQGVGVGGRFGFPPVAITALAVAVGLPP
jgi:hypothetical protein